MKDIVTYTVAGIGERQKFFDDDARRDAINLHLQSTKSSVYRLPQCLLCRERSRRNEENCTEFWEGQQEKNPPFHH